jgi:hypothetical protein
MMHMQSPLCMHAQVGNRHVLTDRHYNNLFRARIPDL